ncbi:sensor histidine kinase [Pseudodesulfovibrio sediminis]|uniref:histidine kinase n=1 Tax=Pseudodesulfovibrio sediminis TaxID=2810563 RepID=A0ABM8I410_9BACT|nr:HAMP domain-containing sensor histidine kinase [Pseudodesulfovibrio sediminis]BCS90001.1 hypothetical protein PSDVSF_32430 [Pseudodesulfovibrio sediminis]
MNRRECTQPAKGSRAASSAHISPRVLYRRSRPLLGILLLAVITVVALPLVNTTVIYPAYTHILVKAIETQSERLARHTIPSSVQQSALTNKATDSPMFMADVYRLEHEFGMLGIIVYSSIGKVIYSSDRTRIGTTNNAPYYQKTVAQGETSSHLVWENKKTSDIATRELAVVKTVVPILKNGRFLGAFEFHFNATESVNELKRFTTYATYGTILTCALLLGIVIILLSLESARIKSGKEAEELRADVELITRHDLKAPLIGVLNGIQYLTNYTPVTDDQKDMLKDMRSALDTGLDMINRSLDIYKIETGKYTYVPEDIDVINITRRVMRNVSGEAQANDVELQLTRSGKPVGSSDSLTLQAEETLLYSLLGNLIKNAIEASDISDTVSIAIDDDDANVSFTIHNTMPVPEAIQDSFFNKYTTANKRTGTGLGTYSARIMTEVMNGTITMRSSNEEGTTITVTLPKCP